MGVAKKLLDLAVKAAREAKAAPLAARSAAKVVPAPLAVRGVKKVVPAPKTRPPITISSQRYLDDETVAAKAAGKNFDVAVSPLFKVGNTSYRAVLDGHHRLAAARAAGVKPVFIEQTAQDHDTVSLLDKGKIDDFLSASHLGDDYYDVDTGRDVDWEPNDPDINKARGGLAVKRRARAK
jgi:hypothetical protein